MDFTKVRCISETCKDNNIIMDGEGGYFGGRICMARLRCPICDTVIMIIPMSMEYEYGVTATTRAERKEACIKKAKEESQLKLAKEITRIKESDY